MRRCRSLGSAETIRGLARLAAGIITVTLATKAGHAQGYEAEGQALRECYDAAATYYGSLTCDPPAAILGAVFGKCTREEGAFRRALSASRSSDPIFLDNVMRNIQTGRGHKLQSIILDARIAAKKVCP